MVGLGIRGHGQWGVGGVQHGFLTGRALSSATWHQTGVHILIQQDRA